MEEYPKRLIEVDLPIKRISAHARREKSIRHGHISTLHIWWARRPLAACRAVLCASLWPDPADENCPPSFREEAARLMQELASTAAKERSVADLCDPVTWGKLATLRRPDGRLDPENPDHLNFLRFLLLDFIADFANWDASAEPHYLKTARALTQVAHDALGSLPGTRPLVVDPFAGGGAIPLEALRMGADAFASDLNPVAVLLNKAILEYMPRFGHQLADEVLKWGAWIKDRAEKELAEFYPEDPDGATPIAYLWARTVICEGPGCSTEVPLIRGLWLAQKKSRRRAIRWVRNEAGQVQTETVEKTFAGGETLRVRRPVFAIFRPRHHKEVEEGTVRRGAATCPVCGYTTPVASTRRQLRERRGGTADARLFVVVTLRPGERGRVYRLAGNRDLRVAHEAASEIERRVQRHAGPLSLVPDEHLDIRGIRHTWAMIYGLERWGDYFTPRQALALTTLARLVREAPLSTDSKLATAVRTILALAVDKQADRDCSLCRWISQNENIGYTFGRQAIGMMWDFVEAPWIYWGGGWQGILDDIAETIASQSVVDLVGLAESASAVMHPLPDDAAHAFVTDPPYYDSVPYAHLSDFFYVWLRRSLGTVHGELLAVSEVPKDEEIVVDRPHELSDSTHDIGFYERELTKAFAEGRRVLRPDGIGSIVFASKTTASWEAILQAVVDSGWTVTGAWPIDTERQARIAAQGQARLASSVHIICRPRENPDGSLRTDDIGDWRDVLAELPKRIHEWMPRLTQEGVVGADAIFACLGPALEIFSRFSRVERASGEQVTLREYLEYVWAAVSKEALDMIFEGADATGFEPDARLAAMWLWTLSTAPDDGSSGDNGKIVRSAGYTLEFDAARKIAQGLGAHLERMGTLVEIKGAKARLLPVAERTRALSGKEGGSAPRGRKAGDVQMSLFEVETEEGVGSVGDLGAPPRGSTVLDRVHQAMLLFAAGRGEALRRFLVEEGAGQEARFWKLAQALSALYPAQTDEKRWVDGVLARKKGLGF